MFILCVVFGYAVIKGIALHNGVDISELDGLVDVVKVLAADPDVLSAE